MSPEQSAPLGDPYPQDDEEIDGLEFVIPRQVVPSFYAPKDRKMYEARVTAGVRRALVEFRDGQDVKHEAVERAAQTVIAFLDGMGS